MADIHNRYPSDDDINKLFDNAVISFDSSALLDLYGFTDATKMSIFENIFNRFKGRFWLPHQVMSEYLNNRERVATTDNARKYQNLVGEMAEVEKTIASTKNRLETLSQKLSAQDKHPYPYSNTNLPTDINEAENLLSDLLALAKKLHESLRDLESKRKTELQAEFDKDLIYKGIRNSFEVGEEFTIVRLIEIVKEGSFRYPVKIPPGYEDFENKKKIGLQKYGDLILWKQLLEYAEKMKTPVIFVCNETKSDWLADKEKKIPRIELFKEFHSVVGELFGMYNLSDFMYEVNQREKGIPINEDVLREVEEHQNIKESSSSEESVNDSGFIELQDIDENTLMAELKIAVEVLPFVSIKLFVRDILGRKGYKFESSYALINQLIDAGKIVRGQVHNLYGEHDVTTVDINRKDESSFDD